MAGTDDHRRPYERWLLELSNGDESFAEETLSDDFVTHQARGGVRRVRGGGRPALG